MINKVTIRTPQFLGSQDRFDWTEQSGSFSDVSLLFEPDFKYQIGRVGPHKVQFKSREDFEKYCIKIHGL